MSKLEMITNSIGYELARIPAGIFMMGSSPEEKGRFDDETPHQVTVGQPFRIGRTVITRMQWERVMGTKPWEGEENVEEENDAPAVQINWYDAIEFCTKLSAAEGKAYRLPTEAEWEYACRGGAQTAFHFGNSAEKLDQYAWFEGNSWAFGKKHPHRVAQKRPNSFGLYDMHGNVWEWCS
ncbi:MAG: formylglycine-generating enzyme family protein, partial [Planctomycetota bacterium]